MIGLFLRSVNELPTMMLRRVANVRYISQTNRILEKSSSSTSTPPPQQPPSTESSSSSTSSAQPWQKPASAGYKLTNFDKRILVWSGKYKNVNETPSIVAVETINRARDQCRVKACLWMMLLCVGGCIIQIVRGRRAAERGETLAQSNREWHRQYNESAKKETTGK